MSCTLCSLQCPHDPVTEGEKPFCCPGCLTVFRILQAQEYKENFRTHPLFQQALTSGLISNPHFYEEVKEVESESETLHLEVNGMWCPSCAEAIRLILMRQKGVYRCLIDYATDLGVIEFSPRTFSKERLFELIARMGYQPTSLLEEERKPARTLWIRFAVSVFCAMNLMMLALPLYIADFGLTTEGYAEAIGWLSLGLSLPLVTYCAWPIWRRFTLSLRTGLFGMETLVFIGTFTAFVYSTVHLFSGEPEKLYYDSMGMLLTFVLLGKILERRAKFSAKKSLFRITRSLPKKGLKRMPRGEYATVSIKEIKIGDRILARTGEKVVLDGVVVEGSGLLDASVMTGEAIPIQIKPGSRIVGGSILIQGSVEIEVTADIEHSLLSKITHVIERDLREKGRLPRLIDQIVPCFVPFVVILAALAYPWGGILRSLSVLLISCPCAIGIAVPLAEARLILRFSEKGALVRNRRALGVLAQNPLFVFDKTGTLTEGKFRVQNEIDLSPFHRSILKGFCNHTTHPIAAAIRDHLHHSVPLNAIKEHIGRGMEGEFEGKKYRLGSSAYMRECAIVAPQLSGTLVHFAEERRVLATISLGDRLRPDIPKVDGVILSGDSQELVSQIAKECGFRWGKGGCNPLEKRAEIEKLKRPVAMVGDGVNDAPALSAADVAISVVSATDIAIEVSDILLTRSSLAALPQLVTLAKKGRRILHQNVFWAFIYNGVGLALAMCGVLTPLLAASAMLLSSLCVLLNSKRV